MSATTSDRTSASVAEPPVWREEAVRQKAVEHREWPALTPALLVESLVVVLPWWVVSRVLCLAALVAARAGWQIPGMTGADTYAVYDVGWFLRIAQSGYVNANPSTPDGAPAFMPLMPFIMRWGGQLLGGQPILAGAIAANLGALVAACALYVLVRMGLTRGRPLSAQAATYAVAFFLVSPLGLPLFLAYTEPILLALVLPAWIAARYRVWWLAGLLASIAVLARITGISFAFGIGVMFLLYAWHEGRGRPLAGRLRAFLRPSLAWLLLPLGVYFIWNVRLAQLTGRPDAAAYAQKTVWKREIVAPWTGMTNSLDVYGIYHDPQMIIEFVATLVVLALAVLVGIKRMWPELALVGSVALVLMSSSLWGSSLRAITVMFPFWMFFGIAAAWVARRRTGGSWITAALMCCGLGLFWCELLIANGVFVV